MTLIQIIVLALMQGLTEFLPVSSSAHLVLGGKLFGWHDQGLVFDVATHVGTLLAVLVYFRSDLGAMVRAWLPGASGADSDHHRSVGACLLLATIPALLLGYLTSDLVEQYLRDVRVIAGTTIGFGLLLWIADSMGPKRRDLDGLDLKAALWIGLAQALALVPGVSRSGVTITAGRFLGFTPESAARFSFLLSIPIIAAAGLFAMMRVMERNAEISWMEFGLAAVFSAMAGWLCIAAFLALLKRIGLLPFVVYRLALGGLLLWLVL